MAEGCRLDLSRPHDGARRYCLTHRRWLEMADDYACPGTVAEPPEQRPEQRPALVVMDETDAAFRLLRDQYNELVEERDRLTTIVLRLSQEKGALEERLAAYEGDVQGSDTHLTLAREMLALPGLERILANWLAESGL